MTLTLAQRQARHRKRVKAMGLPQALAEHCHQHDGEAPEALDFQMAELVAALMARHTITPASKPMLVKMLGGAEYLAAVAAWVTAQHRWKAMLPARRGAYPEAPRLPA